MKSCAGRANNRSCAQFAKDVFRLAGAQTDKQKALAFYDWFTRCMLRGPNPLLPDAAKLGVRNVDDYVAFVRRSLPAPFRLTFDRKVLQAKEQEQHGGRTDDAARVRDLQGALNDPATLAIVATNGGAYLSRILPHIDFSPLAQRRTPLWAFGFSELTGLVNLVASYRGGRGGWKCGRLYVLLAGRELRIWSNAPVAMPNVLPKA